MITRKDIAAHLERSVRTGFLIGTKAYQPLRAGWVKEVVSDGAFETYADMGSVPWPVQNAGKAGAGGTDTRTGAVMVNKLNSGQAIQVIGGEERALIVYNLDWEIAVGITHNAIDDDKAGDLEAWARAASVNFQRHMDYVCFNALNAGEATTTYGACYDTLSFFNDSHVDPGAEYTTTQDNKYAVALSLDNFETVKVAAAKFKDSRGQPLGLNHSLLIVPPDLERTASQIALNREDFATASRALNPYAGSVKMLVAPGGWLDTTAWFLMDSSLPQKPLILQIRKSPELSIWDVESEGDGGTRYYKWHSRYAVCYGDWRLSAQGNT
jgi:phage major head subunit gpT-like protein